MLNNGDAHLQTTLNRHRSLTKLHSELEIHGFGKSK